MSSRTRRKSEDKTPAKVELPDKEKVRDYKFVRIDSSKFDGKISSEFKDCSFEAKERFGEAGDSYGKWSSDKLKVTQGASFIKMKNKMKNRNTHASGRFNATAVNSVKF